MRLNFSTSFALIMLFAACVGYGFLGGILGPNLYGVVLQATGSYHPVFIYLGIFALISAIMIRFVKPLNKT